MSDEGLFSLTSLPMSRNPGEGREGCLRARPSGPHGPPRLSVAHWLRAL